MPNPARILEQLRSGPTDLSVADIRTLLAWLEWDIREGKGSHFVVTSPCGNVITVPQKHQRVKRAYLRMLLKEIDRCGSI